MTIPFLISLGIYMYPQKLMKKVLSLGNYLADICLNFKYRNYKPKEIKQSDYKVTNLQLISMGNPINIITLPINNKSILSGQNLIKGTQIINCNAIDKLISTNSKGFELNQNRLIVIHFKYNDKTYVLPVKYEIDKIIQLPVYTVDDIETCLRVEFEEVSTLEMTTNDFLLDLIEKFAGPKGNFYCDTQYKIKPEYIICSNTLKTILSNNTNDYLQLLNNMGEKYNFVKGWPIIFENV